MSIPVQIAPLAYVLMFVIPAVSLYALLKDQSFANSNVFHVRSVLERKQYHRMITPAFLHGDTGHLLINMLTYFFFAPTVEAIYGTLGFALIFFGSQLGAQGLSLYLKRKDPEYRSLGASGAVSGILIAFCMYAPLENIYLFFAIPMPALVFAILYIGYSSYAMRSNGRIAHEAHLGGAIAGAAIALLMKPGIPI